MLYLSTELMPEKEGLAHVVMAVVEAVGPDKIFCNEDFLLILISNKYQKPLSEYKTTIQVACPLLEPKRYTIYNTTELERLLLGGHLFYSLLCQKEHLVFDSGSSPLPLSLYQRLQNVQEKANQVFSTGFARAYAFLQGALFYMEKCKLPLAAFMLHQATEQALRTIILTVTGIEVRTHAIIELKQHLKKCAPQLSAFLAGHAEMDKQLLDKLEKAYTASRYTDGFSITYEDALLLSSHVRRLLDDTKQAFDDMIAPFLPYRSFNPDDSKQKA